MKALRYINDAIQNPDKDFCQYRIYNMWCEDGWIVYIYLGRAGWRGIMPDSIGNLTKLASLMLPGNGMSGAFPSTICGNLPNLFHLQASVNRFTSLPDCWDTFPSLNYIDFSSNFLTSFPPSLARLNTAVLLKFDNNLMSGNLPATFSSPILQSLIVSTNTLSGSIPTFPISSSVASIYTLNSFDGSNNRFTTFPADSFLNAPNLDSIRCSNNLFTGSLPPLTGCSAITTLDLSLNGFTGTIPTQWSGLTKIVNVLLKKNSLVSPLGSGLSNNAFLQKLDLSYNQISVIGTLTANNNPCWIMAAISKSASYVDLSYNLLAGPCETGMLTAMSNLKTLVIAGNNVTTLPTDLFSGSSLTFIDFSNNKLTGALPAGAPSSLMTYADFTGNPSLIGPTLPAYLVISTKTLLLTAGTNYLCGTLSFTSNTLTVWTMDSSYYSYLGCSCQAGYFNSVPNCRLIPDSFSANPLTNIPALSTGSIPSVNSITDEWYGSNRQMSGLNTRWTIDGMNSEVAVNSLMNDQFFSNLVRPLNSNGNSSIIYEKVRLITLMLHIDLDQFSLSTDIISIYSGLSKDSNKLIYELNGETARAASLAGLTIAGPSALVDSLPSLSINSQYISTFGWGFANFTRPVTIRIQVVYPQTTVTFESRKRGGRAFFLAYGFSSQQPEGFHLNLETNLFEVNIPEHEISWPLRQAIFGIAGSLGVIVLLVMIFLLVNFNTVLMKAASRELTLLTLILIFSLAVGSVLYAVVPEKTSTGDSICRARIWVSGVSLMGILSILVSKSFRVSIIFGSRLLLQIRNQTGGQLMRIVAIFLTAEILMLAVMDGNKMTWADYLSNGSNEIVKGCNTGNGFTSWIGVQIALFLVVMISGGIVAFRTRSVPSAFNESTHILLALQMLTLFLIILVPLDFLVTNPEAAVVIQGGGQIALAFFLLASNFGPKIYYLINGRGNDKSLIFDNSKNSSNQNTSSHSSSEQNQKSSENSSIQNSSRSATEMTSSNTRL